MNDAELNEKLKAAQGPALDADYVADFPRQVLAGLRSGPQGQRAPARSWWPRLGWGAAATACLLAAFAAGHGFGRRPAGLDVLANAKVVQEALALFPNRVRAIVHDQRGLNLVLADRADVPVSPPIYVRLCEGGHCASAVTFSGQEIELGGQKIGVLSDGSGGIILDGGTFVWSSHETGASRNGRQIEAHNCRI